MSDLTTEQIKAAIHRALQEVADQFAWDPRPTDGSVRAAIEKAKAYQAAKVSATPPGSRAIKVR
jgi:hypothetical protein